LYTCPTLLLLLLLLLYKALPRLMCPLLLLLLLLPLLLGAACPWLVRQLKHARF
jgi:hypothetical protein